MWKEIIRAEYIDGYRIMIWFNDGVKKVVDLSNMVRQYPVFHPLIDRNVFKHFCVTDTLEWQDGKIDVAPEYLYDNGVIV